MNASKRHLLGVVVNARPGTDGAGVTAGAVGAGAGAGAGGSPEKLNALHWAPSSRQAAPHAWIEAASWIELMKKLRVPRVLLYGPSKWCSTHSCVVVVLVEVVVVIVVVVGVVVVVHSSDLK